METLIARSIFEAAARGIGEVSLGLVPVRIGSRDGGASAGGLMNAVYWSVSRFQRGRSLHHFKQKFGPRWSERYLAVPNSFVLPEVLVALARAHVPGALPVRSGLEFLGFRTARWAA
jgi:phosphatidylglycerol lysyltransferase